MEIPAETSPAQHEFDDTLAGPSRRTVLAAERTWLAWWRTGIAVSAAAIAVGGVIPHLVGGSKTPFIILGVGYAFLALAVFVGAYRRHLHVEQALISGGSLSAAYTWMLGMTVAGAVLSIATLVLVILD